VQLAVCAAAGVGFALLDSSVSVAEQLAALSQLRTDVWICALASGTVCTALPQTLELFALRVTPPAQAALIYCTIPVWGTALSVAFLGEPLTAQALAGGCLIVLCSTPWGTLRAPEEGPGAPAGAAEQGQRCARCTEAP